MKNYTVLKLWNLKQTNTWTKQYRKLDSLIKCYVDIVLIELASSTDPTRPGEYKRYLRCYAYSICRKYRILYSMRRKEEGIIELVRVGDHKAVYNND